MNEILNTLIIGSGPAGLTAGIYASRAELKPVIIAGLNPGGQLMQTTEIENFPGFENGIMGPELMQTMIKQAEKFGSKVMYEMVESVDFKQQPFKIKTDKAEYLAKTVIIAMGADANWLNLPNEQRLRGKGVSACATCDGFFFKNKDTVVIGGGDAAMEEANYLTKFANKVTVIHRSEEFRASKIMFARAQANPKIVFMINSSVVDVLGTDHVEGVTIKNTKTGEETDFKTDGVFLAIGHTPNTKILNGQIDLDEKKYVIVKNNTRTNIEGVFVAGDISDPRYRQAVSAAGIGAMAALDVEKYLAEKEMHE
ncbi:MAG: NADPH-dependent thioredoxin reductase [Candidatus Doudnabacteria bacterium Gr01-1014_77]|uniref:Thioredoxin reductase n=1 Tax=Candidatus Doudnabacteria bacterium Gr01-1014_77 TaxID=2017133 RepID=A0A554JDA7_9BACT|nr:MAG: NADPH-dependent thioredoxin reductase [Candidatus Doudnabacteria bacterium Gr01-1014_77]